MALLAEAVTGERNAAVVRPVDVLDEEALVRGHRPAGNAATFGPRHERGSVDLRLHELRDRCEAAEPRARDGITGGVVDEIAAGGDAGQIDALRVEPQARNGVADDG